MDIIVSNAPTTEVQVSNQPPLDLTISNAPSIDVSVSGNPAINILMETKVIGGGTIDDGRLAELERRINELERSSILPLYE